MSRSRKRVPVKNHYYYPEGKKRTYRRTIKQQLLNGQEEFDPYTKWTNRLWTWMDSSYLDFNSRAHDRCKWSNTVCDPYKPYVCYIYGHWGPYANKSPWKIFGK
jgi:hypothetical protein